MLKYLFVPILVSLVIAILSSLLWVYFDAERHGFMVATFNSINMFFTIIAARQCSNPKIEKFGGFLYLVMWVSLAQYIEYKHSDLGFPWWHDVMMIAAGLLALTGNIDGNDDSNG